MEMSQRQILWVIISTFLRCNHIYDIQPLPGKGIFTIYVLMWWFCVFEHFYIEPSTFLHIACKISTVVVWTGYVTDILDDAKVYASHANKKVIDADDVKLAVQCKMDHTFTTPPPRDVSMAQRGSGTEGWRVNT